MTANANPKLFNTSLIVRNVKWKVLSRS